MLHGIWYKVGNSIGVKTASEPEAEATPTVDRGQGVARMFAVFYSFLAHSPFFVIWIFKGNG